MEPIPEDSPACSSPCASPEHQIGLDDAIREAREQAEEARAALRQERSANQRGHAALAEMLQSVTAALADVTHAEPLPTGDDFESSAASRAALEALERRRLQVDHLASRLAKSLGEDERALNGEVGARTVVAAIDAATHAWKGYVGECRRVALYWQAEAAEPPEALATRAAARELRLDAERAAEREAEAERRALERRDEASTAMNAAALHSRAWEAERREGELRSIVEGERSQQDAALTARVRGLYAKLDDELRAHALAGAPAAGAFDGQIAGVDAPHMHMGSSDRRLLSPSQLPPVASRPWESPAAILRSSVAHSFDPPAHVHLHAPSPPPPMSPLTPPRSALPESRNAAAAAAEVRGSTSASTALETALREAEFACDALCDGRLSALRHELSRARADATDATHREASGYSRLLAMREELEDVRSKALVDARAAESAMATQRDMAARGERSADALRAAAEKVRGLQAEVDAARQAEQRCAEQVQHLRRQSARAERLARQKEDLEAQLTSMRRQRDDSTSSSSSSHQPIGKGFTPASTFTAPTASTAAAAQQVASTMPIASTSRERRSARGGSALGPAAEAAATIAQLQRALAQQRAEHAAAVDSAAAADERYTFLRDEAAAEHATALAAAQRDSTRAAAAAVDRCLAGCVDDVKMADRNERTVRGQLMLTSAACDALQVRHLPTSPHISPHPPTPPHMRPSFDLG